MATIRPSSEIPWGEGVLLPCVPVDDHKLQTAMKVASLVQAVLDPTDLENPKITASDARKRMAQQVRGKVQRSVTGAKKSNVIAYGQYILEGFRRERELWDTPTMQLFREDSVELFKLPDGNGVAFLLSPGDFLVNTDGETQRMAWAWAAAREPEINNAKVAVTISHGRSVSWARQIFHDFNLLGVRPNVAVGISMDSSDVATRIARELEERSPVLKNRVMQTGRQLGQNSTELVTISALRSAVVTTLIGRTGLGLGSKPIGEKLQGIDESVLLKHVLDVWKPLLEMLIPEFNRRNETVVSAPVIMAGLGVLAHQTLPNPPRSASTEQITSEDVQKLISQICWDRSARNEHGQPISPWEGIAGKITPTGKFSIGGIKEYGHAVIEALADPDSEAGKRVRLAGDAG
ncbi:hypothetical protein FKR81_24315 [Lentzea tibetensis]|uniref:Uncharacterized protein n=1 Tax=Lentzea tibetensis TaxID=2591470 RepID=A0A563EPH2_9PSEU|nr:DNA sulfur modification protein DndB [Lentzea tibetensis]TWP49245.1 hypothetical protein FKR81_24315 [Lentzea tibetensis]